MGCTFFELLISNVQNTRILWDMQHPHYHNRLLVDREWSRIAEVLGVSKETAKSKWKNLKDKFKKEFLKIPKQHSGDNGESAPIYSGTWCHFNSLLFLKSIVTPRETQGNITLQGAVSQEQSGISDSEKGNISLVEQSESQLDNVTEEITLPDESGPKTPIIVNRKRKRSQRNEESIDEKFLKLEARKVALLEQNEDADEDINFFKSLLPHVRLLPSINKLYFRSQVQNLLANELFKIQDNIPYSRVTKQQNLTVHVPSPTSSSSTTCFSTPMSPVDSQHIPNQQDTIHHHGNTIEEFASFIGPTSPDIAPKMSSNKGQFADQENKSIVDVMLSHT